VRTHVTDNLTRLTRNTRTQKLCGTIPSTGQPLEVKRFTIGNYYYMGCTWKKREFVKDCTAGGTYMEYNEGWGMRKRRACAHMRVRERVCFCMCGCCVCVCAHARVCEVVEWKHVYREQIRNSWMCYLWRYSTSVSRWCALARSRCVSPDLSLSLSVLLSFCFCLALAVALPPTCMWHVDSLSPPPPPPPPPCTPLSLSLSFFLVLVCARSLSLACT